MILLNMAVWATPYKKTMYKLFDQIGSIWNIFSIYLPALNRCIELNKIWRYLLIISVLIKSQTYIQLYFLVIIATSLVHKNSKYLKKILEMAEFICYLSRISLIFFNNLQYQIHGWFIVYIIQMLIILQQHICCIAYLCNFFIGHVNNNLIFLALSKSILAMSMASCMAIILISRILCFKICDSYSFLLVYS